jgi:oligoendopeptidase F
MKTQDITKDKSIPTQMFVDELNQNLKNFEKQFLQNSDSRSRLLSTEDMKPIRVVYSMVQRQRKHFFNIFLIFLK